jgi:hypothetical protein
VLDAGQLNAYDVLVSDDIVFTKAAYDAFVASKRSWRRGGPRGTCTCPRR